MQRSSPQLSAQLSAAQAGSSSVQPSSAQPSSSAALTGQLSSGQLSSSSSAHLSTAQPSSLLHDTPRRRSSPSPTKTVVGHFARDIYISYPRHSPAQSLSGSRDLFSLLLLAQAVRARVGPGSVREHQKGALHYTLLAACLGSQSKKTA